MIGDRAWVGLLDAAVSLQSDRRFLTRVVFPALRRAAPARILFVGCRGYTASYGKALAGPGTAFWTTDIDPEAARWGEPGRHVVCDARFLDEHFPARHFDVVMLNGVLGWGIDGRDDMERTIAGVHAILTPGGLFMLGWNSDRIADPSKEIAGLSTLFDPAAPDGLPQRRDFPDVTHVFAFFRAR